MNLMEMEKNEKEPLLNKNKQVKGFGSILKNKVFSKKANDFVALDEFPQKTVEKEKKKFFSQRNKKNEEIQPLSGLEISLMPEESMIIPRLVRSRSLILFAYLFVILSIFVLIWLYINWHFQKIAFQVVEVEREMQFIKAQSNSFFSLRDEIADLEQKATRTENILNNHIYWTKFFDLLEEYTVPDVYFGDFKANTDGRIILNGSGKDLLSIAQQIVVFSQATDFVKEVSTSGIAKTPIGIKADFNLVLADNVFKK